MDSLVVRLFEQTDLQPLLESKGVTVVPLGLRASSSSWSWLEAARRVRQHIRSFRPDIVHTSLFVGNLVGQMAAEGTGVPVLSTLTLTGDERLHKQLQPGAGTMKAAILRRFAGFVGRRGHVWYRALTNDTATTNCKWIGIDRSRVVVIPRGVQIEDVRPDRARFGIPNNDPLVVNVGRLAAQKGQQHLLRAFRVIKDRLPSAHLAIAGREGDALASLQSDIADLGLEASVHLLGYREDVSVLLASADVFLFTSLAEGLGTAVIEAMAVDLPVVAFDIPPIREITNEGQYATLVPVGNAQQLAGAALEILNGLPAPISSGWVAKCFAIDRVALKVQTALQRVVDMYTASHRGYSSVRSAL